MKINMNDIFDNISIENAERIKGNLGVSHESVPTERLTKSVIKEIRQTDGKKSRYIFRSFVAVSAAACIILSVGLIGHYGRDTALAPLTSSGSSSAASDEGVKQYFSVMQVYASDEQIEISDNTIEAKTPFYQINVKPCTWQEANELVDQKEYVRHEYYQYGEYDDARDGSGYMVSTTYGNYFDIKGENIKSLTVTAEKGYLICNFSQNPNFNDSYLEFDKSGNVIGGEKIELDGDRLSTPHKIMWEPSHIFNYDSFENKEFDYDSFSYSDLDDTLCFTATIDDNGTTRTETIKVELTFDEQGIMHTNTK